LTRDHQTDRTFEKDKTSIEKAKVYFTEEITPEALQKIYHALGVTLRGKVAVKISTGEPGGHNFLQPALIAPLVQELNGTIVECNTAYEGRRNTTAAHWETMKLHGWTDIAPVDILDEDGELEYMSRIFEELMGDLGVAIEK